MENTPGRKASSKARERVENSIAVGRHGKRLKRLSTLAVHHMRGLIGSYISTTFDNYAKRG